MLAYALRAADHIQKASSPGTQRRKRARVAYRPGAWSPWKGFTASDSTTACAGAAANRERAKVIMKADWESLVGLEVRFSVVDSLLEVGLLLAE